MRIKDITDYLETIAPLAYQESYDNSGLLVGDKNAEIEKALLTLDVTEEVVQEAIDQHCGLIIAHHPIIFGGLKKLTGSNYVERTVIKAIQHNIAIYAIHTNYDNVWQGVNAMICRKLGLSNCRILAPKKQILRKLVTFVPVAHHEQVQQAVFAAGAGHIGNYSEAGFNLAGSGTFRGNMQSQPAIGTPGVLETVNEIRFETIYPLPAEKQILAALMESHPYEEVAYDIYTIENEHNRIGSGMVGELTEPIDALSFLTNVKSIFKAGIIRHTDLLSKKIRKVAVCGGSGKFLLNNAINSGSDIYITSDVKYHEFFEAEGKIILADIGHFESEQFTVALLAEHISEKFPTFATRLSVINTNPIKYL